MTAIRAHHTANAQLACRTVGKWQYDIGRSDAREFGENGARGISQSCARLPLLQQLPEGIAEEADQDVRLDAFGLLVPHRADGEIGFVNAKGGFGLGELDVGSPELFVGPARARQLEGLGYEGLGVTARFDGAGGDKSIQANCSGWGGCARPRFRYAQRQGPSQTAPSCFGCSGAAGRVVVRNAQKMVIQRLS